MHNKTIVDTSGKVLQQGSGDGVIIASASGVHLLDISEASDDAIINLFAHILNGGIHIPDQDVPENADFEILADQPG